MYRVRKMNRGGENCARSPAVVSYLFKTCERAAPSCKKDALVPVSNVAPMAFDPR